ncbi:MAG: xanthine dehydrogenase family protein molybdopterin-binding subunit [Acetobacteraceae bacterium]
MPDGTRTTTGGFIGRALRRREDAALLTGQGRFAADITPPPGTLAARFLRAPAGPARIAALDAAAAGAMPGVVAVFTAADLPPAAQPAVNRFFDGLPPAGFAPLSGPEVPCAGAPVALVLAESAAEAEDAVEAILLDLAPADATEPGVFAATLGNGARAAPVPVAAALRHARLAPAAMEPRAALAVPEGGRLRLHLSSQTPHRAKADLAAVLGLDPALILVAGGDVGGSFGAKASITPEEAAVAAAAWRLQRPVRWVATRSEEFLSAPRGRGLVLSARMGFDATGRALSLAAEVSAPLGHRLTYSAAVPARNAARCLPGPYAVAAVAARAEGRMTPEPAIGIYRGAGRPEAAILLERLMDRAAARLGLSPAAIRRRNLLPPDALPHRTPTGETLDSGDYPALLDRALALAGGAWEALAAERDARRARGEHVGLGLACYVEPCGQGWESARIELTADGRIVAATGSTAQGQGRETAAAQTLAEALRLADPSFVTVLHGDTDATPEGIGALASRSTGIGGGALWLAAERLQEAARPVAARLLNAAPEEVAPAPGGFALASDPSRRIGWAALGPLSAEARFTAATEAWSAGCVIARVAVDADTGAVTIEHIAWADDVGTIVNPMLAKGQMWGGLAQGIGEVLCERIATDGAGTLLSGSFMDYALPRAEDMPLAVAFGAPEAPARALNNPLGAKGIGEAGTIGVPAALLNAVSDAVGGLPEDVSLPLTPETIWRLLRRGGTP